MPVAEYRVVGIDIAWQSGIGQGHRHGAWEHAQGSGALALLGLWLQCARDPAGQNDSYATGLTIPTLS